MTRLTLTMQLISAAVATLLASVDQARFVAGTLQMLRRYHEQIKAIEALTVAGTVVGRTADAATVIAASTLFGR